jgi:hypothetical protein
MDQALKIGRSGLIDLGQRYLLVLLALGVCFAAEADAEPMRTMEGRYVRIITDLPESAATQQWAAAVDAAVPEMCAFWQVPIAEISDWRMTACVMTEKAPFVAAGLLPASVPDFPHGFQIGNDLWVIQQPSEYYTRHLLIHEVAHAFAFQVFGGAGPPWFMEGTAEYLATHRWDGQRIELGVIPESSSSFPYWGRFRLIDSRRRSDAALSLVSVLRYSDTAHRQVEPYAWTWAAVHYFVAHPKSKEMLLAAARRGSDATPDFTRQFVDSLGDRWTLVRAEWRVFIDGFDYGYDRERNHLELALDSQPIGESTKEISVRADLGWQTTGVIVPQGTRLRIRSAGSVQLDDQPQPWISHPAGVTLKYHRGQPIGQLQATILPPQSSKEVVTTPLEVFPIGEEAEFVASETGWLLLRVADNPSDLDNNEGSFLAEIVAIR